MTVTTSTRSNWLVLAGLVALGVVPIVAGIHRLTQLAGGAEVTPANARFFAAPVPVVVHILAVIPFALLGAFQVSAGFRRRHRRWHRNAGPVVAALGLAAALTGLWMAHFYPWPEGDGELLYVFRLVFGVGMALSLVLALVAIRRRHFLAHGAWMLRGYAIGMGAGTQVLTHLPWFLLMGRPGELARALLMGAGWVINLVVAEWYIRARLAGAIPFVRPADVETPATHEHQGATMETRRLLIVLTTINAGMLAYQLFQPHLSVAAPADVPAVIRGRALEIVDDRGRVRASLSVLPEDPKVIWKGEPYPETVLLRLMSPDGRPNVKLGASKRGAGLVIGGESNPTYVQVLAEGGESSLKLINKDGLERLIKP